MPDLVRPQSKTSNKMIRSSGRSQNKNGAASASMSNNSMANRKHFVTKDNQLQTITLVPGGTMDGG